MSEQKLRVFQINDYEWFADYSYIQAIKKYIKFTGVSFEEGIDKEVFHELSDNELNKLKLNTEENDKDGNHIIITFAERLKQMTEPDFFATTEF